MKLFMRCPHCGKLHIARNKKRRTNCWCVSCRNWFYVCDLFDTYPWYESPMFFDSIPPSYWEEHPEEIVKDEEEPLIGEPATNPYEGLKQAIEDHQIKFPEQSGPGINIPEDVRKDITDSTPEVGATKLGMFLGHSNVWVGEAKQSPIQFEDIARMEERMPNKYSVIGSPADIFEPEEAKSLTNEMGYEPPTSHEDRSNDLVSSFGADVDDSPSSSSSSYESDYSDSGGSYDSGGGSDD